MFKIVKYFAKIKIYIKVYIGHKSLLRMSLWLKVFIFKMGGGV